jgi:predicted PP-loop superfamily ATPase
MGNVYKILVGKPEGKRPLGRCRHRWKNNVKMYLREIGLRVWIGSIWLSIGTGGRHSETQ